MKRIYYLPVFLFILLISCYAPKMQIVSLESDKIAKNDTSWTYKDSLVEFWFNFYSQKGNDMFVIYNKNAKPVFCDLKNSFVEVNDFKKDFWHDVSQVNGNLTFKQYKSIDLKTQNPINETIIRPDRIIMIPPNSIDKMKTFVHIKSKMYETTAFKMRTDTVNANWTSNKIKKTIIKTAEFTKDNSPSKVRLFLTLSKTEDFKNPEYFDFYFWVSSVMEMDARQATQSSYPLDYSEGFYGLGDQSNSLKHPYKRSWRFYIPDAQ